MEEGYMDVYKAAELWDSTPREISMLCQAGLVKGVRQSSLDGRWEIPLDAPYPYNTTDAKIFPVW